MKKTYPDSLPPLSPLASCSQFQSNRLQEHTAVGLLLTIGQAPPEGTAAHPARWLPLQIPLSWLVRCPAVCLDHGTLLQQVSALSEEVLVYTQDLWLTAGLWNKLFVWSNINKHINIHYLCCCA